MSEQIESPVAVAEIPSSPSPAPATPPPSNELSPGTDAPSQNSLGQKIGSISEKVLSRFNIIRKGRGRPRNDGKPKISDVVEQPAVTPLEQAPVAVESNLQKIPVVDGAPAGGNNQSLTRRAIASAVKGILAFAKTKIKKRAGRAGISKEFADRALAECEVEPEVMTDFNESLQLVCEKYKIESEYAPEAALLVSIGRMAAPFWALNQAFEEEIKRIRARESAE